MTKFKKPNFLVTEEKGKKIISLELGEITLRGVLSDPVAHKLISKINDDQTFLYSYTKTLKDSQAHQLFELLAYLIDLADYQGFDLEAGLKNVRRFQDLK